MAKKKSKMQTPDWILEGYDSEDDYNKAKGVTEKKKGKTFKIKTCPKCGSDNVRIQLVGEEGKAAKIWECRKCSWHGVDIDEKELTEDEFMEYLDEKGEDVA